MFKAVIKVKLLNPACKLEVNPKGDWIDLHSSINRFCPKGKFVSVPLGVCVKLPAGYEAIVASRSSIYQKMFMYNPNAIGVIDNTYCGNDDEWKWTEFCCRDASVEEGQRLCQFRIQLSQHATFWQRVKWLFTSGVQIKYVNRLSDENRGGFGTSGK